VIGHPEALPFSPASARSFVTSAERSSACRNHSGLTHIGGTMPGIDMIRERDIVGFDVRWTPRGLRRITAIHPCPTRIVT
jgi:hypothetical protein